LDGATVTQENNPPRIEKRHIFATTINIISNLGRKTDDAIPKRWRIPPEKPPTLLSATSSRFT